MNSVTEAGGERKLKEHVGGYFSNQWPVASVYRGDGACEERADPSATPRDDKPKQFRVSSFRCGGRGACRAKRGPSTTFAALTSLRVTEEERADPSATP